MKELVWFLIIFICMELTFSKPQHLQEQLQYHLDPQNQPQLDYPIRDQSKRTVFPSRHYVFGKHVAVDSNGNKYLLGYTPLNVKYPPFFKPVAVFKPTIHHSNNLAWKSMKQYLPPMLPAPTAVNYGDSSWKPMIPVYQVQRPSTVVVPQLMVDNAADIKPIISGVQPPVPVIHSAGGIRPLAPSVPVKPPLHNYFFFPTPVAKPVIFPQQQLFHVARPQLPVLPLGASFPVSVAQSPNIQPSHVHGEISAQQPVLFHPHHEASIHNHNFHVPNLNHHPALFSPSQVHSLPMDHGFHFPTNHHHQVAPEQPQSTPVHNSVSFPVSFPPISVEFHGSPNLNPFNNQFSTNSINATPLVHNIHTSPVVYGKQPHSIQFPFNNNNENHTPHVTHLSPPNNALEHHFQQQPSPQYLFNPAVQPGQSDLQIPGHLPNHHQFTQMHAHGLQSHYPSYQDSGNIIKPSISLEPPFTVQT